MKCFRKLKISFNDNLGDQKFGENLGLNYIPEYPGLGEDQCLNYIPGVPRIRRESMFILYTGSIQS